MLLDQCFSSVHKDNNDYYNEMHTQQIQIGGFTFHTCFLETEEPNQANKAHAQGNLKRITTIYQGFLLCVWGNKANEVYEAQNSDFHPFVYLNTADLRTQRRKLDIGIVG